MVLKLEGACDALGGRIAGAPILMHEVWGDTPEFAKLLVLRPH